MGKERHFREARRTFPGYLSSNEQERERRRTDAMVKGILGYNALKHRYNQIEKQPRNPIETIGITSNFRIKIDYKQKTVLIKEKNIVTQCPFKLSIKQEEVEDIIKLLTKSVTLLHNRQ